MVRHFRGNTLIAVVGDDLKIRVIDLRVSTAVESTQVLTLFLTCNDMRRILFC